MAQLGSIYSGAAQGENPVALMQAKRARKAPAKRAGCSRSSIPKEVFKMLVENLGMNQASLMRFSAVCVDARDAVLRNHKLWYEICRRQQTSHFSRLNTYNRFGPAVVRNIPMAPYPNFKCIDSGMFDTERPPYVWNLKRSEWPHLRNSRETGEFTQEEIGKFAAFQIQHARLTYGGCCGMCGNRHRHLPVWGLKTRVCSGCLKKNLISSVSLMHEYDFDFSKHTRQIQGKVYFFRYDFSARFAALNLTDNPLDFTQILPKGIVFFWRPHLERLFDLEAGRAALKCPQRRAAAVKLTGALRGLCVRLMIGQKGKPFARSCSHKFYVSAKEEPKARSRAQFWSSDPLTKEQLAVINAHLPTCYSRRAFLEQESAARALLQRSFLAFRGDLRICAAAKPESVLEGLRMSEATRQERCHRLATPSFYNSNHEFRQWQDLPPEL